MRNITLDMQPINPERADEDLKALLGKVYRGLSTYQDITVHVDDEAQQTDETKLDIDALVSDYFRSHDPAVESQAEQARRDTVTAKERLKELDIDVLKAQVGKGDPNALLAQILVILKDIQKSLNAHE